MQGGRTVRESLKFWHDPDDSDRKPKIARNGDWDDRKVASRKCSDRELGQSCMKYFGLIAAIFSFSSSSSHVAFSEVGYQSVSRSLIIQRYQLGRVIFIILIRYHRSSLFLVST
jgi:hypothetical protein